MTDKRKKETKNLLELISDYSKFARCKVNIQKSVLFLYVSSEIKNIIYKRG